MMLEGFTYLVLHFFTVFTRIGNPILGWLRAIKMFFFPSTEMLILICSNIYFMQNFNKYAIVLA